MGALQDPYVGLVFIGLVLLVPFLVLATTTFIKIAVVLFMVRNALGVQQAPPNLALYAIAIVMSVYIMTPVGDAMYKAGLEASEFNDLTRLSDLFTALVPIVEPLTEFMRSNTSATVFEAFVSRAQVVWPDEFLEEVNPSEHILVLIPAFMLSELTKAFEIGLLLYLPFVVIDLVVANVLTALGMMMMSPVVISMPIKLLIFVLVEGWFRLIDGLILSYV